MRPSLCVIDSPTNPNGKELDQLSSVKLVEASNTTTSFPHPSAVTGSGKQSKSMGSLERVWRYLFSYLCVCTK